MQDNLGCLAVVSKNVINTKVIVKYYLMILLIKAGVLNLYSNAAHVSWYFGTLSNVAPFCLSRGMLNR